MANYIVQLVSDAPDPVTGERPSYTVDRAEYERLVSLGLVLNVERGSDNLLDPAVAALFGDANSATTQAARDAIDVTALTAEVDDHETRLTAAEADVTDHETRLTAEELTLNQATSAATANYLMKRDASGRAKVADGSAATDIATKGQVDAASTADRARANHTGTQLAATISDLTETVQDIVAAFVVAGANVTVTYDDVANTFTIDSTGGGGGATDPEIVRDVIGTALVAGSGIQITVNDAGDTITIASTAVLPTRTITAGTGLSGGGDLSANRTLSVSYGSAAGTSVQGNDARVTADQAAGTASIRTLGTGAQQAKAGNWTPGLADLPAKTMLSVVQNGGGTWPDRPTSRTDVQVMWIKIVGGSSDPASATSPAVNGAYSNDLVAGV